MIIPLMMPAGIPYHIVVVADLFAILIVKQPFGGIGLVIYNSASWSTAGEKAFISRIANTAVCSYPPKRLNSTKMIPPSTP